MTMACRCTSLGILLRPENRSMATSAVMAASDERISVSSGPMKFETRNCVAAKAAPHPKAAPHTPSRPRHPLITTTRYAGRISDTGAQIRPTSCESRARGNPVTVASVVRGMPMEPNATGAVLASRQIPAA